MRAPDRWSALPPHPMERRWQGHVGAPGGDRVTELHVLDVARIEDGPVATWRADVALPAAFHGMWRQG